MALLLILALPGVATGPLVLCMPLHLLAILRGCFGQGLVRTLLKLSLLLFLYSIILIIGMVVTTLLAVLFI